MSKTPLSGTDKLWSDLGNLDPTVVCKNTLCRYESGMYVVPFMGGDYLVDPADQSVKVPDGHPPGHGELTLLILAYLVDGEELELGGKWISEKEVPGGSIFFTGPHKMPLDPIASRYGSDPGTLLSKAASLGGTALEFGDASIGFKALPRIPCAFVLWTEDDEFPAEVTVMFDETIPKHLPVDVILALVSSVVKFLV
ncbi:MAG: DUF3786 domain-containing protein [Spirochaetales bacterium]|jgi:hypothetical protein|nr:DUF3786 domain-containing protein [Spirochaetales bacterium]